VKKKYLCRKGRKEKGDTPDTLGLKEAKNGLNDVENGNSRVTAWCHLPDTMPDTMPDTGPDAGPDASDDAVQSLRNSCHSFDMRQDNASGLLRVLESAKMAYAAILAVWRRPHGGRKVQIVVAEDRCVTFPRKKFENFENRFFRETRRTTKTMKIPKTLSPDSQRWLRKISRLLEFDEAEGELLKRAAELRDEATRAALEIEEAGPYYQNRFGEPRQHPALRIHQQSIDLLARILKQLKITETVEKLEGEAQHESERS